MKGKVPFDQRDGVLWIDGQFVDWKDAKIHVLNHGLSYGSCIFEGERIYNGKIFKAKEHLDRFLNSANLMNMNIDYSQETLANAKNECVKRNNIEFGYMKMMSWRGCEELNIAGLNTKIHTLISVWNIGKEFNKLTEQNGLKVGISKWTKPHPSSYPYQAKIGGGYVVNTLVKHEMLNRKFDDGILLDYKGDIAEGSSANFFAIMNGSLITPLKDSILNGITRQTVIDLAKKTGVTVIEKDIKPEDLADCTEAFFTGSAAGISPIIQIENYRFDIGPVTKGLICAYSEEVTL